MDAVQPAAAETSNSTAPFLNLPREIRQKIYTELLELGIPTSIISHDGPRDYSEHPDYRFLGYQLLRNVSPGYGLLSTNKQLHDEYLSFCLRGSCLQLFFEYLASEVDFGKPWPWAENNYIHVSKYVLENIEEVEIRIDLKTLTEWAVEVAEDDTKRSGSKTDEYLSTLEKKIESGIRVGERSERIRFTDSRGNGVIQIARSSSLTPYFIGRDVTRSFNRLAESLAQGIQAMKNVDRVHLHLVWQLTDNDRGGRLDPLLGGSELSTLFELCPAILALPKLESVTLQDCSLTHKHLFQRWKASPRTRQIRLEAAQGGWDYLVAEPHAHINTRVTPPEGKVAVEVRGDGSKIEKLQRVPVMQSAFNIWIHDRMNTTEWTDAYPRIQYFQY